MKPSGIVLVFFAVALTFSSCATPQKRAALKELRAELANYTDVLRRSEITLSGGRYSRFGPHHQYLCLEFYLRPEYSNREAVITVRNRIVAFLDNNWDVRATPVDIYVYTKKGRETRCFYYAVYREYAGTGFWVYDGSLSEEHKF